MKQLEIFEPAMCCSTGVCGVDVDPVLARFAADLEWVSEQNVRVFRYNLSQAPGAFASNPAIVKELEAGMDRLPVLVVDGRVVSTGIYPSREQLVAKLDLRPVPVVTEAEADNGAGSCCKPGSGCC
jgi:hypothetical protein